MIFLPSTFKQKQNVSTGKDFIDWHKLSLWSMALKVILPVTICKNTNFKASLALKGLNIRCLHPIQSAMRIFVLSYAIMHRNNKPKLATKFSHKFCIMRDSLDYSTVTFGRWHLLWDDCHFNVTHFQEALKHSTTVKNPISITQICNAYILPLHCLYNAKP